MNYFSKFINIILVIILIYLWNKFVVNFIIKRINTFHKTRNVTNINKQPIKFVIENETQIIRFAQGFYWIGGIIVIINLLFRKSI